MKKAVIYILRICKSLTMLDIAELIAELDEIPLTPQNLGRCWPNLKGDHCKQGQCTAKHLEGK